MASTFPLESRGQAAYTETTLRNHEACNLMFTTHKKKITEINPIMIENYGTLKIPNGAMIGNRWFNSRYLTQTSIFEWYVVRCGSKSGHQKDMFKIDRTMCSKYDNLLDSLVNIIWTIYMTQDEHKNLHLLMNNIFM